MRLYDPKAVLEYVNARLEQGYAIDIIEGCLQDTYIIYRENRIEVFREHYMTEWESCHTRHFYKHLPHDLEQAIEEQFENDLLQAL